MTDAAVISLSDVETALSRRDVIALKTELVVLVREGTRYDSRDALGRLGDATGHVDLTSWPSRSLQALVRALDHLHNLEQHEDGRAFSGPLPLILLRTRTTAFANLGRIEYDLFTTEPDVRYLRFFSSSGEYNPGDRLVHPTGQAFTVLSREPGNHHDCLTCAPCGEPDDQARFTTG